MKILIDFTQVPLKKTGVGVYAINLVSRVNRISENDTEIIIVAQDDDKEVSQYESEKVKIIKVPSKIFRNFLLRICLEQFILPVIALCYSVDAIHSLHYSFPIIPITANKIVTIHDLTFFLYPEYHLRHKTIYFRLFIRLAAKLADKIIVISDSTSKDLMKHTNVNHKKIKVIHLGGYIEEKECGENRFNRLKERYGIHQPYILYVGMIEPRKNLVRAVRAFHKLLNDGIEYQFFIAGKIGWKSKEFMREISKVSSQHRIILSGYINDDDKRCLLRHADIFLYPSMYEGFGIPIIEAMSFSVPTICSNRSSMSEIAGDACILVDPENTDAIYKALHKLIYNKGEYDAIKKKSKTQAVKFNWDATWEKTMELYRSIG